MTSSPRPTWPPVAGLISLSVLLLAIGVVVGSVWRPLAHDDARSSTSRSLSVTDIGFAQDMSMHHDQAILMARTVLAAPDIDPTIRGLADQLVLAQTAESATMRGWLQLYGIPQTSESPMAWMTADDARAHHHPRPGPANAAPMPGLASAEEIGRLSALRGDDAETLFLQLMIRHHRAGLEMAQATYNDPRSGPATKQLALSMIGDQGNEIGQMTLLLQERGADPLPT
ncbi:DUF305 domain-containing protein [Gordonia aurantiaca]|uniref:DUF305 domain-containing protein n=1 Tax=Gordonia sp. B21 TaxID=3151852 RepID=UPI0032672412